MIYITGDTHADFSRFTKRQRCRLPFKLTEKDIVIVCGDFGLLWERNDKTLKYNLDWMSRLPFKILWVSGNHENYDMLEDYQLEEWHGGKVRHILRDQIIYLERGQVFKMSIPIEISILFGNSEHPFPERKNMPFRSRVQPFI